MPSVESVALMIFFCSGFLLVSLKKNLYEFLLCEDEMLLSLLSCRPCIPYFLREKSPYFFFFGRGGGRIKNEKMQGLKGFATSSAALNYVRRKYEILTYSVLHTVWGLYGAGMDGIQGPLFSTFCCFLLGILLAKQKVCILLLASYFLENFFFFFFISRVSVSEL